MEKIEMFTPAIVTLVLITSVGLLLDFLFRKKYFREKFNSLTWISSNPVKIVLYYPVFLGCLIVPALEALVFRLPLLIMFDEMTTQAWYILSVSSVLFGLVHVRSITRYVYSNELSSRDTRGILETDDAEHELKKITQGKIKASWLRKYCSVVFFSSFGFLIGYYGITYQSLWLSFWIHVVWNLVWLIAYFLLRVVLEVARLIVVRYSSLKKESEV